MEEEQLTYLFYIFWRVLPWLTTVILGIYGLLIKRRLWRIEEEREREKQMQKQKAVLFANIGEDDISQYGGRKTTSVYKLYIYNTGYADARNVNILLDDKPLPDHPDVPDNIKPIPNITAQDKISYRLNWPKNAQTLSSKRLKVNMIWEDDLGADKKEQTLTP